MASLEGVTFTVRPLNILTTPRTLCFLANEHIALPEPVSIHSSSEGLHDRFVTTLSILYQTPLGPMIFRNSNYLAKATSAPVALSAVGKMWEEVLLWGRGG